MENESLIENSITKNLKKLLVGSRMIEVSYGETFNLCFQQYFHLNKIMQIQLRLTVDTLCWIGNRGKWMSRIDALKQQGAIEEVEDCLLAFELTRLRYRNLIQVERVDFYSDFLVIEFPENNSLHIQNCAESDYAWVLEEIALKAEQERMSICCQDNMLYQNNMPYDFLSVDAESVS